MELRLLVLKNTRLYHSRNEEVSWLASIIEQLILRFLILMHDFVLKKLKQVHLLVIERLNLIFRFQHMEI